jgi:hypothetical protein
MITDPLFAGQQLSSSSEKGRLSLTTTGASGTFDGLAREPRRHGVQLACVVFPGRSGGPGGVIDPPRPWIGTTVGLMNVNLWLLLGELMANDGQVV